MIKVEEQVKVNDLVKIIKNDKKFGEELLVLFENQDSYIKKCLCYRYAVMFDYNINIVSVLLCFSNQDLLGEVIDLLKNEILYNNVSFIRKCLESRKIDECEFIKLCKSIFNNEFVKNDEEFANLIISLLSGRPEFIEKVNNILNEENAIIYIPLLKEVLAKGNCVDIFDEGYKKNLSILLSKCEARVLEENGLIDSRNRYNTNSMIVKFDDELKEEYFLSSCMRDELFVKAYEELLVILHFVPFRKVCKKSDTFMINSAKKFNLDSSNGKRLVNMYLKVNKENSKVRKRID